MVWSGINLISHAQYQGQNEEEVRLLGNLLNWLTRESQTLEGGLAVVSREHPDKIDISLALPSESNNWPLWREAYYPRWHAELTDSDGGGEVPICSAGPGFMLMPLDTDQDLATVSLEWKPSVVESGAVLATVFGVLFLGAHVVDGLILKGNSLTWLKIAVLTRIPTPFLGDGVNEDWARRKRMELERGEPIQGPIQYKATEAIPWLREKDTIAVNENGEGASDNREQAEKPPQNVNEEELLESWLNSTGHVQDEWAARLLDDQEKIGDR